MKLRSKRSSNEKEKENLRHQKVSQVQQTIHSHQTLTNQEAFNQVYKDLSQPGAFTQKIKKWNFICKEYYIKVARLIKITY